MKLRPVAMTVVALVALIASFSFKSTSRSLIYQEVSSTYYDEDENPICINGIEQLTGPYCELFHTGLQCTITANGKLAWDKSRTGQPGCTVPYRRYF